MISLFREESNRYLFQRDGEAIYYGIVFSAEQCRQYFKLLWEQIEWRNDEAFIYGKHYITKRKVAWYGDKPFSYSYSQTVKTALPWTPNLLRIKSEIEKVTGERYNSCLLNLYHSGEEGMAWHSDDEKELLKNGSIASVTFGAARMFSFRHKVDKQIVSCLLEDGSLLEMRGACQTWWQHRLPPTKKVQEPRINLTFRKMNER